MALEIGQPIPPLRRDIGAVPIEHDGQPMFLIEDPEGLSGRGMAMSPSGMVVVSLFDGQKTAEELRALYAQKTGAWINAVDIFNIAKELDTHFLLESPAVQHLRLKIIKEFKESSVRKAMLAGGAYPSDRLELSTVLGAYFNHGGGPGKPLADRPSISTSPLGLVSPHIDFGRGGPSYAFAYQALSEFEPPDVIVALGVAHASPASPWAMTRKAYETPYGAMNVDLELYQNIAQSLWYNPEDDEWAHRSEHSLEFQAVWLKFLWKDKTPPWVPILCSSFERFSPDAAPSSVPTVSKAIQEIGDKLKKLSAKKRVMILAGVDLAHVGARFGDEIEMSDETNKKIEAEDRASLAHALAVEPDPFYLSVVKDGHWRKVCGLSALYTSLSWIKAIGGAGVRGSLLSYGQAPDPLGGVVSFASAVFPRP